MYGDLKKNIDRSERIKRAYVASQEFNDLLKTLLGLFLVVATLFVSYKLLQP